MALGHADGKWNKGLLIPCDHPDYEQIMGQMFVEGVEGDPNNWHSGDVDIAIRRFLESK